MKFYTVIAITRSTGKEHPPRYDLLPMNHMAACNFMHACRTSLTDYKIHPWPSDVPYQGVPCMASNYKAAIDNGGDHFAEALESRDFLEALAAKASANLKDTTRRIADSLGVPAKGALGLMPDPVKFHPEVQREWHHYIAVNDVFRDFNKGFIRLHSKRWRDELRRRRASRNPQPA